MTYVLVTLIALLFIGLLLLAALVRDLQNKVVAINSLLLEQTQRTTVGLDFASQHLTTLYNNQSYLANAITRIDPSSTNSLSH